MIIVGLGNPGEEYARTRHNAGFLVLEEARREWGGGRWRRMRKALVSTVRMAGGEHRLVRPTTFMNASGEAVEEVLHSGGSPAGLIVVLDDMDLPLGRLRLRAGGGAGGHRGLQSILAAVAPASVPRLRVGVGRPQTGDEAIEHVLGEFDADEWERMEAMLARAVEALALVVRRGLTEAMDRFNGLAAPWEEGELPGKPRPPERRP